MRQPLANDAHGNPIDVPQEAVAWRVRLAGGRRGRPKNVYDPETGRQLELPISATFESLCEYATEPGRYRLEAIDRDGKTIGGVIAFTEVPEEVEESPPATPSIESARLLAAVEHQSETLCRALEALAQAFGPLHPQFVQVQAPQTQEGENLGNLVGVAKQCTDMFRKGQEVAASVAGEKQNGGAP